MIHAKAWSDCRQFEIEFDATLWARQASDEAIIALGACGFRGDYPADDVVMFMADNGDEKAAALFEFLKIVTRQPFSGDTNGFECEVDSCDLLSWLAANRPNILSATFTEGAVFDTTFKFVRAKLQEDGNLFNQIMPPQLLNGTENQENKLD
jgi:hypothetical protein